MSQSLINASFPSITCFSPYARKLSEVTGAEYCRDQMPFLTPGIQNSSTIERSFEISWSSTSRHISCRLSRSYTSCVYGDTFSSGSCLCRIDRTPVQTSPEHRCPGSSWREIFCAVRSSVRCCFPRLLFMGAGRPASAAGTRQQPAVGCRGTCF